MIYDAAVLGLGTMGSFTCLELAKRSLSVIGIDRFHPPHGFGSHSGDTRVFRTAYAESPLYVNLARHAGALWDSCSEESGVPLLTRSGMLSLGPADAELISGIRKSAELHDVALDILTREEIRARYPVFQVPEDHVGAFEPTAGWIDVQAAIEFALDGARHRGAHLLMNQADPSWEFRGDTVAVRSSGDEFLARWLVITAGAWASSLLPSLPLTLRRKVMIWVAPETPAEFVPCRFPVFAVAEKFFYGFPDIRNAGVKLAIHADNNDALPDHPAHVAAATASDILPVLQSAAKFLPALGADESRVIRAATCLYTMTPDEHFIIDRHRDYGNVWFAAGFSGHGFKFAPAIGEILADMVTGIEPRIPIDFLRSDRFQSLPRERSSMLRK
jgi:sarcosine oxidase